MLIPRASLPVIAAAALFALGSCKKDDATAPAGKASAKAPPAASTPAPVQVKPQPPEPPPPAAFDVPFKGKYTRTAKVTYKNGQRVRLVNAAGVATMTIEPGKVTYVQTYPENGKTSHVTETYTFTQADVHQAANGFDVPLTFQKLD